MRFYLLCAATVLASPPTIASGFLDIGHLSWGTFLINSGSAYTPVVAPKPVATESAPTSDPDEPPIQDQSATLDASRSTPNPFPAPGVTRHTPSGVSP